MDDKFCILNLQGFENLEGLLCVCLNLIDFKTYEV
ncbi:hypothetical protein J2780_000018 [Chryseobacterium camelliae]|nr:hypothetical protein [Chryseobacterium camelliae]